MATYGVTSQKLRIRLAKRFALFSLGSETLVAGDLIGHISDGRRCIQPSL